MTMTKTKTIAAIKAIGRELSVRATPWGELRVTYAIAAIQLANDCSRADAIERAEQCAYYASDDLDAIGTAQKMHDRYVKLAKI